MSSDKPPVNPYAASERGYVPEYMQQGPPRQSSGAFSFIAIVSMILGGLGLIVALTGVLFLVSGVNDYFMKLAGNTPGMSPDMQQVQQDFIDKLTSLNNRYFALMLAQSVFHIIVAGGLLYGGIRAIQRSRQGVGVLASICAIAIAFELIRLCISIPVNMESQQISADYQEKIMAEQMKNAPPAAKAGIQIGQQVAGAVQGATLCFLVGWVLLKVGFYIFAFLHLRKPQTQALLR